VYDWISAGKIPANRNARGVRWLDDEGLATLRAWMKDQQGWKAIKQYLIEKGQQRGNSNAEAAAKKRVQRYRESGRSLQDIAGSFLPNGPQAKR
ncbi:MAG: hypothetical protein ACREOH_07500, partial [Candidatus Entotheonellia bacterium]